MTPRTAFILTFIMVLLGGWLIGGGLSFGDGAAYILLTVSGIVCMIGAIVINIIFARCPHCQMKLKYNVWGKCPYCGRYLNKKDG